SNSSTTTSSIGAFSCEPVGDARPLQTKAHVAALGELLRAPPPRHPACEHGLPREPAEMPVRAGEGVGHRRPGEVGRLEIAEERCADVVRDLRAVIAEAVLVTEPGVHA